MRGISQAKLQGGIEPLWHRNRRCPMTHAKRLWSIWQALLSAFAWAFTRPSSAGSPNGSPPWPSTARSTPSPSRSWPWSGPLTGSLESFAEYGAWHPDYVTASLTRLVETAPRRLWHGYHISAVDDTKVHRNSPDVWGTCTFHEYTARCPNRASHRAGPQLGGARGPARQPRSIPLVPAPVGTALLPEIPVASSIPGLRSHRSFPRL